MMFTDSPLGPLTYNTIRFNWFGLVDLEKCMLVVTYHLLVSDAYKQLNHSSSFPVTENMLISLEFLEPPLSSFNKARR